MSEVRLKNYLEYLKKLEKYSKLVNIKLVTAIEPSDGRYVPALRKIVIDSELSESTEIATILHELGHFFDDMVIDLQTNNKLADAYTAVYGKTNSKKQLAMVIACEKRAWNYGKAIAKQLNIPLGKWYEDDRIESIAAYKK